MSARLLCLLRPRQKAGPAQAKRGVVSVRRASMPERPRLGLELTKPANYLNWDGSVVSLGHYHLSDTE